MLLSALSWNVAAILILLPFVGARYPGEAFARRADSTGGDATAGNGGSGRSNGLNGVDGANAQGGDAIAGLGGSGGSGGAGGTDGADGQPGTAIQGSPGQAVSGTSQYIVEVSLNGELAYDPSDIRVPDNTFVTFVFPQNIQHSVTQSTFASPCTPLGNDGFDSGLTSGGTTFSVYVPDASIPIYFFCKAAQHCGAGMVGTINAPSSGNGSNTEFVAAAKAIGSNEQTISDNGPKIGGQGAVATAGPTSGTPTLGPLAASTTSGSSTQAPSPTTSSTSTASRNEVVQKLLALTGVVLLYLG